MKVGDIVTGRMMWGGSEHELWFNENVMSDVNDIVGCINDSDVGIIIQTIEPNDQGLLRVRILLRNGVIGWTHARNLSVICKDQER